MGAVRANAARKIFASLVLVLLLAALFLFFYRQPLNFLSQQPLELYFSLVSEEGETVSPVTRPVPRRWKTEERLEQAIRLLLAGPDEAEKSAGYETELPTGAELISCWVEGDIAFLNFSPRVEDGGGTASMRNRLRQIVFTATQFPGINRVRFLIDGEMIKYFSSEGLTEVENPLGRSDFEKEEE